LPAGARDGTIVCLSRSFQKFKTRYPTLVFGDAANLDDGGAWPTHYAQAKLTAAEEKRTSALLHKAVS
jgi:hypothetical protein